MKTISKFLIESYNVKDAKDFIKDYERDIMDYDDAFDRAEELIKNLTKSSDNKVKKIAQNALKEVDKMDDFIEIGEYLINAIEEISKL